MCLWINLGDRDKKWQVGGNDPEWPENDLIHF